MNVLEMPTMKEIEKIPHNGYYTISLFAGAGGSSLGYRMAGFKVIFANEFIRDAQVSYSTNNPNTILSDKDIRELTVDEILELTNLKVGELDILDGSPPCAQFSSMNQKNKTKLGDVINYSGKKQRVDDLFFEYIRILRGLRPKVFIAENVVGLSRGPLKEIYLEVLDEMTKSGYKVDCKVINAADYGVPQRRQRLIFMGVRNDLGVEPSYPNPLSRKFTASEALPHLLDAIEDTGGQWSKGSFINGQCPTIRAKGNGHLYAVDKSNPDVRRKMTTDEVKKLSSFPVDFDFNLSSAKSHERIGRAVPPLMMYHIANHVKENILNNLQES